MRSGSSATAGRCLSCVVPRMGGPGGRECAEAELRSAQDGRAVGVALRCGTRSTLPLGGRVEPARSRVGGDARPFVDTRYAAPLLTLAVAPRRRPIWASRGRGRGEPPQENPPYQGGCDWDRGKALYPAAELRKQAETGPVNCNVVYPWKVLAMHIWHNAR